MQQTTLRNSATGEKALSGLAASPVSPALGSTLLAFEPASVLYHRHHFHCIQCIAAGRGQRYGKRCAVGLDLWTSYQVSEISPSASDRASFSSHEAAAEGAGRATPPDGNHGGYFSGERTSV